MKTKKTRLIVTTVVSFIALLITHTSMAEGNRYGLERYYLSDVSAASTYVNLFHNSDAVKVEGLEAVLIDVRDVTEYSSSHVENAYSIPFPHIIGRPGGDGYIAQLPETFVDAVMAKFPDKATPIYTMCRSGFRSVLAANLLADAGYTNVRNVWEGFLGQYKTDVEGNTLDLNNNGELDAGDKDGWANYSGLPTDTAMEDDHLFTPFEYLYTK